MPMQGLAAQRGVARPQPRRRADPLVAFVALVACCAAALAYARLPSAFASQPMPGSVEVRGSTAWRTVPRTSSAVARQAYTTAGMATPPEDLMSIKQRPFTPSAEGLEYAVVEYSGRQHMITVGSMYETYFIRAIAGAKVRFNRVLLLKRRDTQTNEMQVTIGQPIIDGAHVEVTILEHLKSEDQHVLKHKPKKHYMKRYIVQQKLTRFRIDKIVWDDPKAPVKGQPRYPLMSEIPFESRA